MSRDASDTVIALAAAYANRDVEALLALFHPDVEWHTTPGFLWPGPYRGRDALRDLMEHWWEGWATGLAEFDQMQDGGDEVMASVHIHGRSAGSGEDVDVRLNWVFHLREGLIDLVRSYATPDEARAALTGG